MSCFYYPKCFPTKQLWQTMELPGIETDREPDRGNISIYFFGCCQATRDRAPDGDNICLYLGLLLCNQALRMTGHQMESISYFVWGVARQQLLHCYLPFHIKITLFTVMSQWLPFSPIFMVCIETNKYLVYDWILTMGLQRKQEWQNTFDQNKKYLVYVFLTQTQIQFI